MMQNIAGSEGTGADQLVGGDPTPDEKTQALINHTPGVVLQGDFVVQDNPEAITLSLAGNDIGFKDVLMKCINPFQNAEAEFVTHGTCYNYYEDRLELVNLMDKQFPKLRSLYSQLKQGPLGDRRVYVVGYPQVVMPDGDCGVNVALNANEVQFAHDLIDYLDAVIKQAADQAGVLYVDSQLAFNGHRLCEAAGSQVAVNGLTLHNSSHGITDVNGSFHPNALGHQLLADTVASQTDNLTKPMPAPTAQANQLAPDYNAAIFQNIPHNGRSVTNVSPGMDQLDGLLQASSSLRLSLTSRGFYTKPGSKYSLVVGNNVATALSLGSFTADSTGTVSITATLPVGVAPGFQTVHVIGSDLFNNPIDVQQVVFVAANPDDYDNDGIANAVDMCATVTNSGKDVDKDGLDDACDPVIGDPPVVSPAPPPIPTDIVWFTNPILPLNLLTVGVPVSTGP